MLCSYRTYPPSEQVAFVTSHHPVVVGPVMHSGLKQHLTLPASRGQNPDLVAPFMLLHRLVSSQIPKWPCPGGQTAGMRRGKCRGTRASYGLVSAKVSYRGRDDGREKDGSDGGLHSQRCTYERGVYCLGFAGGRDWKQDRDSVGARDHLVHYNRLQTPPDFGSRHPA